MILSMQEYASRELYNMKGISLKLLITLLKRFINLGNGYILLQSLIPLKKALKDQEIRLLEDQMILIC